MDASNTLEKLIGRPIPPAANARYVAGKGHYTDDHDLPGALHMVLLRSPHASARIKSLSVDSARKADGVCAVLTGHDLHHEKIAPLRSLIERTRPGGTRHFEPHFPALVQGEVNHVGFPVAAVIAETYWQALDAAELINVDYETRPAVTRTRACLEPDAPLVWTNADSNLCFTHRAGDHERVEAILNDAAHRITLDVDVSRVTAAPMENRNAVGIFDQSTHRYTLISGNQSVHDLRSELAQILGIDIAALRVVSPDIGGAFGMKIAATPEQVLVLLAARLTGRPVRWQATRMEAFASDWHARDVASTATLGLDEHGHFLALKVESIANLGAYLCANTLHSPVNNLGGLSGPYRTQAIAVEVKGTFSHSSPTSPYRGAGRPEATYVLERVIDEAAHQLGIDPAELRRRNLIPTEALPYKTNFIFTYDSGAFEANLNSALSASQWNEFEKRRADALIHKRLRGIGLANAIEIAGGPAGSPNEEFMEIRFDQQGHARILTGLHSHGQGLETTIPQVLHDQLGCPIEFMQLVFGDTDQVYHGKGAGGSRSAAIGSMLTVHVAQRLIEKGKRISAHLLETSDSDIVFEHGAFKVAGTDKALALQEVIRASFDRTRLPAGTEVGFSAQSILSPHGANFPNGCHVCEIEIELETGVVSIIGYWAVEDVGRVLNPLVVEGQVQGGVVQGLGQALREQIIYDDYGQLVSASFLDYAMPRALDAPFVHTRFNPILTQANTLGVKGAGEAGTVGAIPAIMNAVNHALRFYDAPTIEMPATSMKVWQALQRRKERPEG